MDKLRLNVDQLRSMIGLKVRYHGNLCQVVEVLEDGPALVLMDQRKPLPRSIQADQHGEAHRRVPQTHTITIFGDDGEEFNVEFLALEPVD